jgi:hypothetical protein
MVSYPTSPPVGVLLRNRDNTLLFKWRDLAQMTAIEGAL